MLERYHPDSCEAWQARRREAAAQRFTVFCGLLEQGHFQDITFDERMHEEITKLSQLVNRRLDECQDDRTSGEPRVGEGPTGRRRRHARHGSGGAGRTVASTARRRCRCSLVHPNPSA